MKDKNTGFQAKSSNEYHVATDRFHSCAQEHMMRITHAYLFGQDLCLLEPCSQAHPRFETRCFDSAVHANGLMPNPWQFYQAAPQSIRKEDLVSIVWGRKETQQFILHDCFGPHISQDDLLLASEYETRFPQHMPIAILRNAEESIHCIRLSSGSQREKLDFIRNVFAGSRNEAVEMPSCYRMFIVARDTLPVEILLPMTAKEFGLGEDSFWQMFGFNSSRTPLFSLYQNHPQRKIMPTTEFPQIPSDDQICCWTHGDDVSFSSEISAWLCSVKKEYQTIRNSGNNPLTISKFSLLLFRTLEDINRKFHEVYAFKDMLDDYLRHMDCLEYQAAWLVLYKLVEYQGDGFIPDNGPWDLAPPECSNHPVRLAIKRYLTLLANRELRREVFDF